MVPAMVDLLRAHEAAGPDPTAPTERRRERAVRAPIRVGHGTDV